MKDWIRDLPAMLTISWMVGTFAIGNGVLLLLLYSFVAEHLTFTVSWQW